MKYLLTSALAVLCSATGAQAQANAGSLDRGQKLTEGQRITSPNGSHFLVMQDDGNLCINTKAGKFVWCSMSTAGSGSYALFEDSGNLVVFGPDDQLVWSTKTAISARTRNAREAVMYSPARLSLGDDGKLYMLNGKGEGVWSSVDGLIHKPVVIEAVVVPESSGSESVAVVPAEAVRTKLERGDRLDEGEQIFSQDRSHFLVMQDDGNLCINTSAGKFVWCSMTTAGSGSYAVMQHDGNFVVHAPDDEAVWSTKTANYYNSKFWSRNATHTPTEAFLSNDGVLHLVAESYTVTSTAMVPERQAKTRHKIWNSADGLREDLREFNRRR